MGEPVILYCWVLRALSRESRLMLASLVSVLGGTVDFASCSFNLTSSPRSSWPKKEAVSLLIPEVVVGGGGAASAGGREAAAGGRAAAAGRGAVG